MICDSVYVSSMMETAIAKSRREEYSEATRAALIDSACDLFLREGYQQAGVQAIARAARVTRGAFYHHFADKPAIFEALVIQLQAAAAVRMQDKSEVGKDAWARLALAVEAFLDICSEPAYRRLVIEAAPAVLGSARSHQIEDDYALGGMIKAMIELKRRGELDVGDPWLAGRMIARMICEAALLLSGSDEPAKLRRDAIGIVERTLGAFRTRNAPS